MTLPEKVRDVTQSEWLEVRERLDAAEANAERWRQDAGAARGRYSGVLSALRRVEGERDEARRERDTTEEECRMYSERSLRFSQQADHYASQLALAMAWGAEVCAQHARLSDLAQALLDAPESKAEAAATALDSWLTGGESVAIWLVSDAKRAERAEAERDAMRKERDEAQRGRTSVSAVNAALRDYPDADVSALWVPASEALEYQACWHRDVAKGRAAIEKREADLAAARAQLAAVVAAGAVCREGLGVEHGLCSASALGELLPTLDAAIADPAQAAREHDERVRAEVLRDAAEKGRNDAGWPGFDRVRPDVAAMRLAYECLRAGPLSMRVFQALECGGRGSEAVALGETALAWGDGKVRGRRMLRARLALFIRARLRAEAGDYGPLYCTCFDEPRAVATHRDARHCRKPHPMRITPLWEQAAQWWATRERPGGGR